MSVGLQFLADEDLDNDIVRDMLRRLPYLAIVRGQDVGLSGAPDPRVLEWAAQEGRVLLTHDVSPDRTYLRTGLQRFAHAWDICSQSTGTHRSSDRRPLMTRGMQSSR
jgi:hypothetical protein